MRKVELTTWRGIRLIIDFAVMSVKRPILSAGALARRGYQLVMGEHARLRLGTRLVPLLGRGN
eukprot:7071325-Heterocapsa_arctica.AAC.1